MILLGREVNVTARVSLMDNNRRNPYLVQMGSLVARILTSNELELLTPHQFIDRQDHCGTYLAVTRETDSTNLIAYCKLLRSDESNGGARFSCAEKFASDALIAQNPSCCFLEIGSFTIIDPDRKHRANGLLWQAITAYCRCNKIDYIVGCLPLEGRYPAMHAMALSFLYHHYRAQPTLLAKARHGVSMDIMPPEAIKPELGYAALPPMVRYCIRHGAKVGDGVVVDRTHDEINLFVILPTQMMG